MSQVALDFGTSNTVLARHNETLGRVETLEVPGVSARMSYRLGADTSEHHAWVVPSLIYYGETETLIGDQVVSRGLADHPFTFRWMKRSIAAKNSRRRKTGKGQIGHEQAGRDFLTTLFRYASDLISLTDDSFVMTAPVEAFEDFQDWLLRVAEEVGIQRVRVQDEPTACVFGYYGAPRAQDRFVVFDFGGGTLDIACVRLQLAAGENRTAVQLGQAGCDLGGMNLDLWLAEDFAARHRLDDYEKREFEPLILRQAEAVKIALSDPNQNDATLEIALQSGARTRLLQTTYLRACASCKDGALGKHDSAEEACLGCLLLKHEFLKDVKSTTKRALENAAIKAGMREGDVTRVLVTGGTSLVPTVRKYLADEFGDKLVMDNPFDSVARGACGGVVAPILQHDYAVEAYDPAQKAYKFDPLFPAGTEYPLAPEAVKRKWVNGAITGQTRIGLKIFEVAHVKRRSLAESIVGESGALQAASRVMTEQQYICLNPDNPTFITVDPPFDPARDKRRFKAEFTIDESRRLLVTVLEEGKRDAILKNHPVVRL